MDLKTVMTQNITCKHDWHFTISHLNNAGVPTSFGDYVISVECRICGKKIKDKEKIQKILREEKII